MANNYFKQHGQGLDKGLLYDCEETCHVTKFARQTIRKTLVASLGVLNVVLI